MMPTWARPATIVFSPGPCPCTSADGLSTRRYSAGRLNCRPSSKLMSSRFSARLRRNSTGQVAAGVTGAALGRTRSRRRQLRPALRGDLVVAQRARLVDQHDRDAVADRIGEPGLFADQLLRGAVVAQRSLGQRADQDLQELRVDFGRLVHGLLPIGGGDQWRVPPVASPKDPVGLIAAISTNAINSRARSSRSAASSRACF